jgi:hypothetical protein
MNHFFKLFQIICFIPNLYELYEYVCSLFENILTSGLPHAAAPLDSRTLPRALPHCRTLPRALPHIAVCTAGHSCALCRALPHTA